MELDNKDTFAITEYIATLRRYDRDDPRVAMTKKQIIELVRGL